MLLDDIYQKEVNKIENSYYPFRQRPFQANLAVRTETGKFYARHDYLDPSLLDTSIEQAILKYQLALSKDKYKEPITANMEYGWCVQPSHFRTDHRFYYPRRSNWITKIGAIFALENQKHPTKPFTGIPFKV